MADGQMDTRMSQYKKQLEALVAQFGWAVQGVFANPAAAEPSFSYTIGLYRTHQHPEIVVFGVPPETARTILNHIGRRFALGGELLVPGVRYDEILEGFPVVFIPARTDEVASRMFAFDWFYKGTTPPVLQLVWTDAAGLFPWEAGVDHRFDQAQPLLGERPLAH